LEFGFGLELALGFGLALRGARALAIDSVPVVSSRSSKLVNGSE